MNQITRTTGGQVIERAISCGKCGLRAQLRLDEAYKFDVSAWTELCCHKNGGTPVLCPCFGPELKMALMGCSSGLAKIADKD